MSKREEGQQLLSGIFVLIALLIVFYSARHFFWKKKIDRFEYRLKIFETLIILYTGTDTFIHLLGKHGNDIFTWLQPVCILVLALSYLLMARIFYLKYLGKIRH